MPPKHRRVLGQPARRSGHPADDGARVVDDRPEGARAVIDDLLVTLERSGFVEGRHYGRLVLTSPSNPADPGDSGGALHGGDGCVVRMAVGDVHAPVLLRSVCKPLQAVAVLRSGVELHGHLLALATSSHSGEPYHQDGVRELLATFGLDASALRNTAGMPLDPRLRREWEASGRPPTQQAHNCSGKHAAMLASCVVNGWPTETYSDPGHPLQELVLDTVRDLTGEPVAAVAVDGCGAPVPAVSPLGVARAFARIATAPRDSPEGRVAHAMRDQPDWVAGAARETTRLMRALPGLIVKEGAEAVAALAFPDGTAAAFKISDGGQRARTAVTAAVLRHLGRPYDDEIAPAVAPVLGGGQVVGGLTAVLPTGTTT
jgi:L-asparaginase II